MRRRWLLNLIAVRHSHRRGGVVYKTRYTLLLRWHLPYLPRRLGNLTSWSGSRLHDTWLLYSNGAGLRLFPGLYLNARISTGSDCGGESMLIGGSCHHRNRMVHNRRSGCHHLRLTRGSSWLTLSILRLGSLLLRLMSKMGVENLLLHLLLLMVEHLLVEIERRLISDLLIRY